MRKRTKRKTTKMRLARPASFSSALHDPQVCSAVPLSHSLRRFR
jgi:hypothetical protein